MSKIRNTGITGKWSFRHTCYVATATQNSKDFRNSSQWTCSHHMFMLNSKDKNTDCLTILMGFFGVEHIWLNFRTSKYKYASQSCLILNLIRASKHPVQVPEKYNNIREIS